MLRFTDKYTSFKLDEDLIKNDDKLKFQCHPF